MVIGGVQTGGLEEKKKDCLCKFFEQKGFGVYRLLLHTFVDQLVVPIRG